MQGYKPNAQRAKKKPQGGRIVGPGTGTSDSIQKEVADGSYIMPADSTEAIGEQALEGMGGDVPVNVSNGEFEMPPEQVHAVGVQALDQMNGATHSPVPEQPKGAGYEPEMFFANGGAVDKDKLKRDPAKVIFETTEPNPNSLSNPSEQGGARQAGNWVDRNADQALAAQQGMQGVADRATAGLNIPPSPLPGVGGYDPANPASPKPAAPAQAGQPQDGSGGFFRGVGDLATGSVKTNAGILAAPLGYAADGLRVGAANLFGGDANTLPGGRDKYSSMAGDLLGGGIDDLKRVGSSVQAGGRDLLGVQAAPQPLAAAQPTAQSQQSAPAAVTNPAQQPDAQVQPQAAVDPAQAQVDPAQFAGMANNITRVGNSFSAQGPINQGYTVNGQAQGQTNVTQAPQSAQNQQAVANLLERTPEFGAGAGAAGYQPNSAFAMPQQGGPRVTVVSDGAQGERERRQLWNAASTAHKGAQNGQLTAAQMNTMRGLKNDERTDATSQRNTDANNAASLAREGMSQAGANQRQSVSTALDERKFSADQNAQGYSLRAADRAEKAYERYEKAKTPEEKSAALENLSALRGDREANQNLSNNFMKIKVPAMDAEGRVIGEREELVDLRNQGKAQQMPPIGENPAAMQIKNNTKLSREEKQQQLRALGYQ